MALRPHALQRGRSAPPSTPQTTGGADIGATTSTGPDGPQAGTPGSTLTLPATTPGPDATWLREASEMVTRDPTDDTEVALSSSVVAMFMPSDVAQTTTRSSGPVTTSGLPW